MTNTNSSNIISDSRGNILAIIIRADSKFEGISFLTPDNFGLQIGTMLRPKNDLVPAHIHPQQTRIVKGTQEVLILRSGKMLLELFDEDKKHIQHYLFMRFSALDAKEFFRVANLILAGDPKGNKFIQDMVDDIVRELKKEEYRQALPNEDDDDNLDNIDISGLF